LSRNVGVSLPLVDGSYPLELIARSQASHQTTVCKAIELGAKAQNSVSVAPTHLNKAIEIAAQDGNQALVKDLLNQGAHPEAAILGAVRGGWRSGFVDKVDRKMIGFLVDQAGESMGVNKLYRDKNLLVTLSFSYCETETIKKLLELGASPSVPDLYGRTAEQISPWIQRL